MSRYALWTPLIITILLLLAMIICRPVWVSDDNEFLRSFVSHELLSLLGVILAISLPSLARTHLTLNRIEEERQKECFTPSRREIRQATYWLIGLFALAFILVVSKPHAFHSQTETAFANSLAIVILAMYILVLLDITTSMFLIKPDLAEKGRNSGDVRPESNPKPGDSNPDIGKLFENKE